jgi:small-conductance mechanosensitive channel
MLQLENWIKEFNQMESSGLLLQFALFVFLAILILVFSWLVRKTIIKTVSDNKMRYRIKKIVRIFSYALILLLAIISFIGKVQYFTLTIGLISAGIAFALQEVILSVAGWVAIFSSNIYKPGDRIELEQVKGDVIDIGILRTTLMEIGEWVKGDNYSGRIVQISNAIVFKGVVRNYSTDFPFVWDQIILPVKYGSDIPFTTEILKQIAFEQLTDYAAFAKEHWKKMVKKYIIENANIDPVITLELNDNWIEFNIRYVVDYKKRKSTKHLLFSAIQKAILDAPGKIALASATIDVTAFPAMELNLNKGNL